MNIKTYKKARSLDIKISQLSNIIDCLEKVELNEVIDRDLIEHLNNESLVAIKAIICNELKLKLYDCQKAFDKL